ncbi:hypothetical protein MATL_G00236030 [Megalops atlanticus]|uniref:Uncharacterized protein n=1 Tax=Megalops atlanticus TaxID=7932 RepID=A0A9D3PIU7_MEGAT|nr:hypothetical protein MATL_G00236030 [Megalops atlanticus]
MLSRNILLFSAMVFLATTITAAPVEEKEPEEREFEPEDGEEELSEEEEDDDDSKSQDMNMGTGSQQATAAPKDTGATNQHETSLEGDPSNGQKLNGGSTTHTDHGPSGSTSMAQGTEGANGGDPHAQPSGASSHDPSVPDAVASSVEMSIAGAGDHGSSPSQAHSPGAGDPPSETIFHDSGTHTGSSSDIISETHPQAPAPDHHQSTSQLDTAGDPGALDAGSQIEAPGAEVTGSDAPDTESNGNGHKLLVAGAPDGSPGSDYLIDGAAHTGSAGLVDLFFPDIHTDMSGHMGATSQTDSTALGLDPGQPSSSSSHPEGPGELPGSSASTEGGGPGDLITSGTQTDSTVPADLPGQDHLSPSLDSTSVGDTSSLSDPSHTTADTVGAGTFDVHSSFLLDTTDMATLSDMMSHIDHSYIDYPESGIDAASTDSLDSNGNGRQRPVTETQQTGSELVTDVHHEVTSSSDQPSIAAETHAPGDHHGVDPQLSSTVGTGGVDAHTVIPQTDVMAGEGGAFESGPHSDLTGMGVEPVTSLHMQADTTALGDAPSSSPPDPAGLGEVAVTSGHANSTESLLGAGLEAGSTDSVGLQGMHVQTDSPVTGDTPGSTSQADGAGTVTADPQGIHEGLSQSGVTAQTQPAASAGEQYITSGQGPEGAENVELEDTC